MPADISQWTHRFAVLSALAMIGLQGLLIGNPPVRLIATAGLFGAVFPMIFGMGYLLFPSYVGETLSTAWAPGIHFLLAVGGGGLLIATRRGLLDSPAQLLGAILWAAGVAVFLGTIGWSIAPAAELPTDLKAGVRNRAQRSSRLGLLAVPIAMGYLILGTVALLARAVRGGGYFDVSAPAVIHLFGTGVVVLLILALGLKLLVGFLHVTPPHSLSWVALSCGAVAPAILAGSFYRPPLFLVGAGLEGVAVISYAVLIAVVGLRADRRRTGFVGLAIGAIAGVTAVGIAIANALDLGWAPGIRAHVVLVINGFILSTIIGYAYQFFPVPNGQFWGASDRTATGTILLFGLGTALVVTGDTAELDIVSVLGVILTIGGTGGYAYLLIQRFR